MSTQNKDYMKMVEIPLNLKDFDKLSDDLRLLKTAEATRQTAQTLIEEGKYIDALERTTEAIKTLREFSDFENTEFRAMVAALFFDLSEIHYTLKDYKQSEKDLDFLFTLLDQLIKRDPERFGRYHINAMELSTRILRSRKKTLDLLAKQQLTTSNLYEKVSQGVSTATDKLVDSLCKVAELLSSTGDYRGALKFYAEAIKYSKRRTGRVTRKEVKMTIDMAKIMMRIRSMRPRSRRLLNAILPHAIALETIELEEDIIALIEVIDRDIEHEPKWKTFIHKLTLSAKRNKK